MRLLSEAQALRCETGKHPRCRCRCQGEYHGAARAALPEYFEQLAESDPHRTPKRNRQLPLPPPVGVAS